jgi:hypothetical protein
MKNDDVVKILARAAKTNLERDAMEREVGFGAPTDGGVAELLRTAICALECALKMEDWNCVAEATDMLAKRTNYYPWLHAPQKTVN